MEAGKITFAQKINAFNAALRFPSPLPPGFEVMNPFKENDCATPASRAFYNKYYNDVRERGIILGINPGRFGAGITGVPFTDPKRLASECAIHIPACKPAHEPSSKFVYAVIAAYGGVEKFYSHWYINSICPLGFLKVKGSRRVNANYYDSKALQEAAEPFIIKTIGKQLAFGINRQVCFCMGKGKNAAYMERLNRKYNFFQKIIPLEHPRFIVQYRGEETGEYVKKYMEALSLFAPPDQMPENTRAL